MFQVIVDGSWETARYYKFGAASQKYTSDLMDYTNVCASKSMDARDGSWACGADELWDNNVQWKGLASVDNKGMKGDPCDAASDGYHGRAHHPPAFVWDRCANVQGAASGTVDVYISVWPDVELDIGGTMAAASLILAGGITLGRASTCGQPFAGKLMWDGTKKNLHVCDGSPS